jgi:hypothetical protein
MRMHTVARALIWACISPLALAAPGEYWEMTSKMEMQGMTMPGMATRVCVPKGGEKDPRNNTDKECEVSDVKTAGNKVSWAMRCNKGADSMTGTGEMTTTAERTEGVIKTSTQEGKMTLSFVNKRLGGACDTDEMKKKVDAALAANSREAAKACEGLVTTAEWLGHATLIVGQAAVCPAKKEPFCEAVRRDLGQDVGAYFVIKRPEPPIAKACGLNMDAAKKVLCKSVDANNPAFTRQLRDGSGANRQSLRAECPAEMKTYQEISRKRFCEGRAFTEKQRVSMASCLSGASGGDEAMNTPDPEEPEAASSGNTGKNASPQPPSRTGKLLDGISLPSLPGGANSTDAVIDGAKKLKNLLGF